MSAGRQAAEVSKALAGYEGERARLRPLQRSDHRVSVAWRNDPEIRDRILGHRFPVTAETEQDWVDRLLKDRGTSRAVFAVEDRSDDVLVGFVYLQDIDWVQRSAEFGILIGDKTRRRKGLGREALELVCQHAFRALNLHRLGLRVAAYNEAAVSLFRSAGFRDEGCLRESVFLGDRYHDVMLMGLLRTEFEDRLNQGDD